MSNRVELHRVLKAPVERVYRAFTTPEGMANWMPPFGFIAKTHEMDFRVGGRYKMSFTNFTDNATQTFGGEYVAIEPGKLLRYKDRFDDPNLPGEMLVTVEFRELPFGTEIRIKQENLPAAIPAEMCYLGWQESLIKLAQLVEPEIKM